MCCLVKVRNTLDGTETSVFPVTGLSLITLNGDDVVSETDIMTVDHLLR